MNRLIGIHLGETAWIVGKGSSLASLAPEYFGAGPVITMNQAILPVQALGLSNPVYSLQKDGCLDKTNCPDCSGDLANIVRPREGVTVILQKHDGEILFSESCLPDYSPRILVDPVNDLGLELSSAMSVEMCVKIARMMGCKKIVFLCCDSLANGDLRTFDPLTGGIERTSAGDNYEAVIPLLQKDLEGIPHGFVTPGENYGNR